MKLYFLTSYMSLYSNKNITLGRISRRFSVSKLTFKSILMGVMIVFSMNSAKAEEALFPVIKDDLWGYIDKTGTVIVPPKYRRASQFYDGRGSVQTAEPEKKYLMIDSKGKVVFEGDKKWSTVKPYYDGLSRVRDKESRKYGYIDVMGKLVIPLKYDDASDFSEGLAKVSIKDAEGVRQTGFIDTQGKMVIQPDKWLKFNFSDGLAAVRQVIDGKFLYGFIDTKGEIVIPPRYRKVGKFGEGLAFVNENGQIQMINKKGDVIKKFVFKAGDFDSMPKFSHGFAKPYYAWKFADGTWNIINKKGEKAFPELNISMIKNKFSEGRAWVRFKGSKDYVLIDTKGKVYTKVANVDDVIEFRNGLSGIILKKEKNIYYYNREGQLVWK